MPQHRPVLTGAVEEYLEAIHRLIAAGEASTTRLAEHLAVRPASVTGMLKRLADRGLIIYHPYGDIALTPDGQREALTIIRRHRLVERFLSDQLDMPLDRVHEEACRLEHALSPELETRIAKKLGAPLACPHGHPIDARTSDNTIPLLEAPRGKPFVIARLEDESPEVIRYLTEQGLLPGTAVTVADREPREGALIIEVSGQRRTIGPGLAAGIRVSRPRRSNRT
jgi:DtxR family Mn-dependent transcriptional regulator